MMLQTNFDFKNPPLSGQLIPICDEKHSVLHVSNRRKIRLIESNVKHRYKKNWPVRDFAGGVYLSEAPLPS